MLSEQVTRVCNAHIRPTIQDRGGDIEVLVQKQTARITASGSPGALVPLRSWISGVLKHYISEIEDVQFETGDSAKETQTTTVLNESLKQFIDDQINPSLSDHGGVIHLDNISNGVIHVRFDGRCQGCAMAEVTLRQGVETLIRERFPEITTVVDDTDHEAGTNPYFSPGKGGGAK
ncbi:MAG: NifU family protein [Gammaproteobacteria bacterium]|nr:NifU family protein [Gammaproteobacteria bacterium]